MTDEERTKLADAAINALTESIDDWLIRVDGKERACRRLWARIHESTVDIPIVWEIEPNGAVRTANVHIELSITDK